MITAHQLEVRAGARLLMEDVSFRVGPGDKVGLVGRNGAGKTTLTKILAGEGLPASGQVTTTGDVGYLPQDPRTGDPEVLAKDRILSARGLDAVVAKLRRAEEEMGSDDATVREKAMRRYARADDEMHAAGGYAAESEAATIAASLGIEERILSQPLKTLSGGQRRRVELARILFSGAEVLILDEPTNHLDADSIIWLRDFLKAHSGGFIIISHDNDLLAATVNKVMHLDANRSVIDVYNMGWKHYLQQRETDEVRRRRERMNAENKAKTLTDQANKMRAKASKAQAAQSMLKRAEKMLEGVEGERASDKVARIAFPKPAACGKTPLTARELSKSYGSLEVFTGVDLAIDKGSRVVILGLNGAGKTTMLRILAGVDQPDTGMVVPGHGLKVGYYAQDHGAEGGEFGGEVAKGDGFVGAAGGVVLGVEVEDDGAAAQGREGDFLAAGGAVEIGGVQNPPFDEEVDVDVLLLGGQEALGRAVQRKYARVELTHVLYERHLEVQARRVIHPANLTQLEQNCALALVDDEEAIKQSNQTEQAQTQEQ